MSWVCAGSETYRNFPLIEGRGVSRSETPTDRRSAATWYSARRFRGGSSPHIGNRVSNMRNNTDRTMPSERGATEHGRIRLTDGHDVGFTILPSRAEPSRAEPSRAEPSRAEPSRAEPSRAEPSLFTLWNLWPESRPAWLCVRVAASRKIETSPAHQLHFLRKGRHHGLPSAASLNRAGGRQIRVRPDALTVGISCGWAPVKQQQQSPVEPRCPGVQQ